MSEGLERPERESGTPGEEPTLRNRTVFRDACGGSGESGRWGGIYQQILKAAGLSDADRHQINSAQIPSRHEVPR